MGGNGIYGFGNNITVYQPAGREISEDGSGEAQTNQIKMICSQKNDSFTVDDTTKGNGALTYPVGLITADEVTMGGGVYLTSNDSRSYYLYTGQNYWTMSSDRFGGLGASELYVLSSGSINSNYVRNSNGVRPVISLRSDITVMGTGTKMIHGLYNRIVVRWCII